MNKGRDHMRINVINASRRTLLRTASAASLLLAAGAARRALAHAPENDPWQQAQAIADKFARPLVFRDQDFVVTAHGAQSCQVAPVSAYIAYDERGKVNAPLPGAADCYAAIAAAIAACHRAGGGRVVIPAGNWLCAGPIVLRSNVHVHLKAGAHIYFSNDPADYAKYGDIDCGRNGKLVISRWQSNDCLNYSPLVYAYGQQNIALTGEDETSILDGQGGVPFAGSGDAWWDWTGKKKSGATASQHQGVINPRNAASLREVAPDLDAAQQALIQGDGDRWRADHYFLPALSEAGVPVARRVFGIGHYLRPCMIQLIGCTDVLLQSYQVQAAPFWQHNPVHCRNLQISKVQMNSMGPNSDGFDPECCDTVLVDSCVFNTGDDCIAIKAGKNRDVEFGPTQNILIQNSIMNSGHGGITLGSEMSAGGCK